MPKPLHPPKWYGEHRPRLPELAAPPEDGDTSTWLEVPGQPAFDNKSAARKWLLGSKTGPGKAPRSGTYKLFRQLDEETVVVETVRTVIRRAADPTEAVNNPDPETNIPGDCDPDDGNTQGEAEAEKTWGGDDDSVKF